MNKTILIKKFLNKEKLLKKEEVYLWKKLRDEADKVFSLYIRTRDKRKGCITKTAQGCRNLIEHCCHWIDRGWYSHRRDSENCYGGCASCNTYHEAEHKIHFTNYMIKKHGQERVDEQLRIRNKVKPTIQDLIEIIDTYKNLYEKLLENERRLS